MREAPDTPVDADSPMRTLTEADDALTDALNLWGMSADAMLKLAECRFREDKYTDAVYAYRSAALWQPKDAGWQARLAQAEEYERTAETINRTLPAGYRVISIRPYPSAANSAAWAALYGVKKEGDIGAAQAALYRSDGAELRQICHAPFFSRNQEEDSGAEEIRLCVFPLTGRAAPEIVLSSYLDHSMRSLSAVNVFACKDGRFHSIAALTSDFPMAIERAPHGSRYVIRRVFPTGDRMDGGCSPQRPDLYAFDGKRFAPADAQYPEAFGDYIKEAEGMLLDEPGDYDLRQNLAYMYSITGRPQKVEQYYRQAESDCRAAIANDKPNWVEGDRDVLAQILARDPEGHF